MLKITVIAVLVLVAGLFVYATTLPDTFRVARTTSIQAPPERIFPLINEWRQWGAWSPYEKVDPAMKRSFSGPASGKGAVYEFTGNSKVGAGRLEIVESSAPSRVAITLDMSKPFDAHNLVEFTLQPQGNTTNATWAMRGSCSYLTKLIGIFVNMDDMIGKSFESGLADLKTVAEKENRT
jgi:uncharacterized protein YndB with AHSA1/START domain